MKILFYSTSGQRSRTLLPFLLLSLLAASFLGCGGDDGEDDLEGNWIRRSDFEGVPRSNAVAFTIGDFAYVGLGYDGDEDLNDFWRYSAERDFWTVVDPFPGQARRAAVAFTANGIGYVGTGYNGDDDVSFSDFYAFDPEAPSGNQWTPIADFPGGARYNAVAFMDENQGYVGTGYDDNWLKDFYRYDPTTNSWDQVVSLGGSKRENAVSFSLGGFNYVLTGRNNGLNEYDIWRYDAENDRWDVRNELDEEDDYLIARYGAVAFTLNGFAYVTTGTDGFNITTTWEYDPTTDEWEERSAYEGISRRNAVAFVINGRAFVGTGASGSTALDDLREFLPDQEFDEED